MVAKPSQGNGTRVRYSEFTVTKKNFLQANLLRLTKDKQINK